jgi:hypothetical protein
MNKIYNVHGPFKGFAAVSFESAQAMFTMGHTIFAASAMLRCHPIITSLPPADIQKINSDVVTFWVRDE